MKKISLIVIILILLNIIPCFALAAESNLIEDTQINLKSAENPTRLEINFVLTEPIDLSQGNSDIVFEYFTLDDSGNLGAIRYRKDKSWSGYLNSYDDYPAGERKYSSGIENGQYSDRVPATRIYTSTKTGSSINVTSVAAIKITVLRADGSGERVTVNIDGTISDVEEIVADIPDDNNNMGIIMESFTSELPADTILVANELTSGLIYEKASSLLTDVKHFVAIDITLESSGSKIQPDGKIKISIPIPEYFSGSNLAVYRIDDYGAKIPYPVTVTTNNGISYATFEADHFSAYILAEMIMAEAETETGTGTGTETNTGTTSGILLPKGVRGSIRERAAENADEFIIPEIEENEVPLSNATPPTGAAQTSIYYITIVIIFVLATALLFKNKQKG